MNTSIAQDRPVDKPVLEKILKNHPLFLQKFTHFFYAHALAFLFLLCYPNRCFGADAFPPERKRPVGQAAKTTPSHGVNPGSIPGQVRKTAAPHSGWNAGLLFFDIYTPVLLCP